MAESYEYAPVKSEDDSDGDQDTDKTPLMTEGKRSEREEEDAWKEKGSDEATRMFNEAGDNEQKADTTLTTTDSRAAKDATLPQSSQNTSTSHRELDKSRLFGKVTTGSDRKVGNKNLVNFPEHALSDWGSNKGTCQPESSANGALREAEAASRSQGGYSSSGGGPVYMAPNAEGTEARVEEMSMGNPRNDDADDCFLGPLTNFRDNVCPK